MTAPHGQDRRPGLAQTLLMNPTPLVLLGGMYAIVAGSWGIWAGGNAAAYITGHPSVETYGIGLGFVFVLLVEGGPTGIWPDVPSVALWAGTGAGVIGALTPVAGIVALTRSSLRRNPFSGIEAFSAFTKTARTEQTKRLSRAGQPQLHGPGIINWGVPIGCLNDEEIYAGPEDVTVTYFGPRAGKSTSIAVPTILAAPGPCIATSNKSDLVATTRAARERAGSRTWVFDPAGIVHEPVTWWWDPLEGIGEIEDAMRLAGIFIPNRDGDRNKFFTDSAREYLSRLIWSAAISPNHNMGDVRRWLYAPADPEPVTLLRQNGHSDQAETLASFLGSAARETADNIFTTARTAAACLNSPNNLEWIIPTPGRPGFDVNAFLARNETLYLLSREGELSSAPIVAAFTQRILRAAETTATTMPGGRLDPFLAVVLDEAANIVKIGELPKLYSHYGSRGILVNSIFQNYAQTEETWGKEGARQLWSAATVKLIGSGTDDPTLTRDLVALIGKTDINVTSYSHNSSHGGGGQLSTQREAILDEASIREIGKGTALMFATAHPPVLVDLAPWYQGPRVTELATDVDQFEHNLIDRVRLTAPPTNPTAAGG